MTDLILTILSSSVVSVLITTLIFITKNWFSERLKGSIGFEYSKQLEQVRNEIASRQAVQAAAISSLTAAHLAGYERRLADMDTLWAEVVRLSVNTPPYASHADLLLPEEYEDTFRDNPKFHALIAGVDEYKEATEMFANQELAEKARLFAGEYFFSLFFAYRAVTGRVAYLLLSSFAKGAARCWHGDKALKDVVAAVTTPDELAAIEQMKVMRLRNVQQLIERKMLGHAARVISGEASATENLQQASRIAEATAKLMDVASRVS